MRFSVAFVALLLLVASYLYTQPVMKRARDAESVLAQTRAKNNVRSFSVMKAFSIGDELGKPCFHCKIPFSESIPQWGELPEYGCRSRGRRWRRLRRLAGTRGFVSARREMSSRRLT